MPNGQPRYFDDQYDDEDVLMMFRRHPIVMRKGLIFGSLGLLAGPLYTLILTYVNASNPPTMNFFYLSIVASLLLSAIIFFPSWMSWYFSMYILTTERFIQITQDGFFHRTVSDVPLNLVQSINYDISGAEQTLLGFGTIIMQTFIGDTKLHNIHNPAKVQRKMVSLMKEHGIHPDLKGINVREAIREAHPNS